MYPGRKTTERVNRYRLVIRSLRSDVPEDVRLRQLLKSLLRWLDFRCEEVTEVTEKDCASRR